MTARSGARSTKLDWQSSISKSRLRTRICGRQGEIRTNPKLEELFLGGDGVVVANMVHTLLQGSKLLSKALEALL